MYCAITGEELKEPVISAKSGHAFERRLVEQLIEQTGLCPVTKQPLTKADLIAIKTTPVVKPRPAGAASVPAILQMFQTEWDALMLETYTLKEHVHTLRQELAKALYQHDAACRVIARLIKERDQARAALGDVRTNMAAAVGGQAGGQDGRMETDEEPAAAAPAAGGLPEEIVKTVDEVHKTLSKPRRQRIKTLQSQVAATADIESYKQIASHPLHSAAKPGVTCVDLHPTKQSLVLTGGADSNAILFDLDGGKIKDTLKGHKKRITDVKFHPTADLCFTASQDHTVNVWKQDEADGKYSVSSSLKDHSDAVVGLGLHPSNSYLVSVAANGTWNFYDIKGRLLTTASDEKSRYTCADFHPDGVIFGIGTEDKQVRIFDLKSRKNVATFGGGHQGSITSVVFSENGYLLASGDDKGVVKLWDLRKESDQDINTFEDKHAISSLRFDNSGTYLAVGAANLSVFTVKPWGSIKSFSDHNAEVTGVRFGLNASFLVSSSKDRTVRVFRK